MPEGDTIHRAATRLGQAIAGKELVRIEAPRWAGVLPAVGETVDSVEATGKHLHIRFSGGLVLATHMRMTGSWHLYRPGERWRKAASTMRVLVGTSDWDAVCFSAPDVRFSAMPTDTDHLGPDLCRPDADLDECVRRFALVDPSATVAEALLDQRVCCGVGNVFKSEVCWALRLDPFTPVVELDDELRRSLVEVATAQLQANLTTTRRTTVPGGLAVYGHTGQPCRRCRTPIRSRAHGVHARRTYWCPGCQVAPA